MKTLRLLAQLSLLLLTLTSLTLAQDSARKLDSETNGALSVFYNEINGGKKYLEKAKGYVVFPDITEAGFFIGGKYGEGALRIEGFTKSYHSITSASMGFQAGLQSYSLVIVFTSDAALERFINNDSWETDMDFNIAMADFNNDEELDDIDFGSNMVGFVFDSTGMMGNFTMEGTRFEKIKPD